LAAVKRIENNRAEASGFEIDQVGHVAGGNAKAERGSFDRGAFEKLRVGPYRSDCRHLVDRDGRRRFVAYHRHQRDRRVVASLLAMAAVRDQIERGSAGPTNCVERKAAVGAGASLAQLCRCVRTGDPGSDRRAYDRLATAENPPLEGVGSRRDGCPREQAPSGQEHCDEFNPAPYDHNALPHLTRASSLTRCAAYIYANSTEYPGDIPP
jgi:hypothetical protein